jgi:hypothetical protein
VGLLVHGHVGSFARFRARNITRKG